MPYRLGDLATIMNAKLIGDENHIVDNQLFDSRNILQVDHSLFWAFKGKIDGHDFILDAYEKGVRTFVSNRKIAEMPEDAHILVVDDTKDALQELGKFHLEQFPIETIGITGSNGKTVVKEWLFQSLFDQKNIVRSPKSYNSQIGLPFSVLQITDQHNLGIFEVGISEKSEMQKLQNIFQPTYGVITNVRESHLENFGSYEELVKEKLILFKDTENLVYNVELESFIDLNDFIKLTSFGNESANVYIRSIEDLNHGNYKILLQIYDSHLETTVPFNDKASLENVQCLAATLSMMGYDNEFIKNRISQLQNIEMRLEIKEGRDQSIILRDEFSLDYPSLEIALNVLNQQIKQRKILILSDFEGKKVDEFQKSRVLQLLNSNRIDEIYFIGNQFQDVEDQLDASIHYFNTTEDLYAHLPSLNIRNSAVLIKGARKFGLEKISENLMALLHETKLEVSISNLMHNYNYFKGLLKPETRTMAMVKANAYGLGIVEIAKAFQYRGVDYLGVAYTDEGIKLRKSGIQSPIMVMNPEVNGFQKIIEYGLEPEIYGFRVLSEFVNELKRQSISKPYPIHVKIDTGMHRLGFQPNEIEALHSMLFQNPYLEVVSVFSHLSCADNPEDRKFTTEQIQTFENCYDQLVGNWARKPIKHILNTSGILNYSEFQFDMVRMGIGLYDAGNNKNLEIVAQFKTIISQIKNIKPGDSISYGRKYIAEKPMTIAILPVGYADGVSRKIFNNDYHVFINQQLCAVVGVVCMDMMMVDVTDLSCNEGDEVVIFGNKPKLSEFAQASETISYECLTSISTRIKRIYYN